MEITEVRVRLAGDTARNDYIRGYATVVIDDSWCVRDMKIIGRRGGIFVAMPQRKLTDHCPRCGRRNHLRANFCNACGVVLESARDIDPRTGRRRNFADTVFPVTSMVRGAINQAVLMEYVLETERARMPGYVCRYESGSKAGSSRRPARVVGGTFRVGSGVVRKGVGA